MGYPSSNSPTNVCALSRQGSAFSSMETAPVSTSTAGLCRWVRRLVNPCVKKHWHRNELRFQCIVLTSSNIQRFPILSHPVHFRESPLIAVSRNLCHSICQAVTDKVGSIIGSSIRRLQIASKERLLQHAVEGANTQAHDLYGQMRAQIWYSAFLAYPCAARCGPKARNCPST